jgi:hypothetical protein
MTTRVAEIMMFWFLTQIDLMRAVPGSFHTSRSVQQGCRAGMDKTIFRILCRCAGDGAIVFYDLLSQSLKSFSTTVIVKKQL